MVAVFELARYGIAPLSMAIALPAAGSESFCLNTVFPPTTGLPGFMIFEARIVLPGISRFMATACNRNAIIMTHQVDETWRRREFETLRDLKGVEVVGSNTPDNSYIRLATIVFLGASLGCPGTGR